MTSAGYCTYDHNTVQPNYIFKLRFISCIKGPISDTLPDTGDRNMTFSKIRNGWNQRNCKVQNMLKIFLDYENFIRIETKNIIVQF